MPNPASTTDLENRYRVLTSSEVTNANAFLGDAWALLLARRPTLEADITAGTVTNANVIRVVCAMVLRVLRNPNGVLEFAIDDYRERRDSLVSSGVLHVTGDELSDVTPGRRRQRSIRLTVYGDV